MPMVNYRRRTTRLEYRPSRQPPLDGLGRPAHAYGSDGRAGLRRGSAFAVGWVACGPGRSGTHGGLAHLWSERVPTRVTPPSGERRRVRIDQVPHSPLDRTHSAPPNTTQTTRSLASQHVPESSNAAIQPWTARDERAVVSQPRPTMRTSSDGLGHGRACLLIRGPLASTACHYERR
jgi:hypothetical protein